MYQQYLCKLFFPFSLIDKLKDVKFVWWFYVFRENKSLANFPLHLSFPHKQFLGDFNLLICTIYQALWTHEMQSNTLLFNYPHYNWENDKLIDQLHQGNQILSPKYQYSCMQNTTIIEDNLIVVKVCIPLQNGWAWILFLQSKSKLNHNPCRPSYLSKPSKKLCWNVKDVDLTFLEQIFCFLDWFNLLCSKPMFPKEEAIMNGWFLSIIKQLNIIGVA